MSLRIWITLKLSLEVRSFQAQKNSVCLGPEAGRYRLVCPECRQQDAAVPRWTVSDRISVFPATVPAVRSSMLRLKDSRFG